MPNLPRTFSALDQSQVVMNHPKPGIQFVDFSKFLANTPVRLAVLDAVATRLGQEPIQTAVAIQSRGFLVAAPLADRLKWKLVMCNKQGKLPKTETLVQSKPAEAEYSTDVYELDRQWLVPGTRVLVCDDVCVTGQSLKTIVQMIQQTGAIVQGCLVYWSAMTPDALVAFSREHLGGCPIWTFDALCNNASSLSSDPSPLGPLITPDAVGDDDDDGASRTLALSQRNFVSPSNPFSTDAQVIIIAHPSMQSMADEILKRYTGFKQVLVSWDHFEEQFSNLFIQNVGELANKSVLYLANYEEPKTLFDILGLGMVLPRQNIARMVTWFPYLPPLTHERVKTPGEVASADIAFRLLSTQFDTHRKPLTIGIVEPHTLSERFYATPDNDIQPLYDIPRRILDAFFFMVARGPCSVAFPDEGAFKRYQTLLPPKFPTWVMSKQRTGSNREVIAFSQFHMTEPARRHVLILDDMVKSGGTLFQCFKQLKATPGVEFVSAGVTHAVFPNSEYLKFTPRGEYAGLVKFFVSNSIPSRAQQVANLEPFYVLSIVPDLVRQSLLWMGHDSDQSNHNIGGFKQTPQVILASNNADKRASVEYALPGLPVLSMPTDSKVSQQPMGRQETEQGCQNRLDTLWNQRQTLWSADSTGTYILNNVYVAMENGIDQNQDLACVKMTRNPNHKIVTVWTDPVSLNKAWSAEFAQMALQDSNLTYGQYVHSKMPDIPASDWHLSHGGISRKWLLAVAVQKAYQMLMSNE